MNQAPVENAGADPTGMRFPLWLAAVTAFAWLVRLYFVQVAEVDVPVRGDVRQYVAYAWNMLHHGTFSHVWPGSGPPVPDMFRGPGYPAFLATWMRLEDRPGGWYQMALHAQAIVGALTATLTVLLARHWLARPWAFFAGILVALWPHHVAATGALLTEVVFGFLLMLGLVLSAEAFKRQSTPWAVGGGLAFSAAALTSMVSLLFPVFAAVLFWRERRHRAAVALLLCALLGPGAWSARNASLGHQPPGPGRITLNLVQGSWPQYHRAYASRNASPIAHGIMVAIDREEKLLAGDPEAGVARIAGRMAAAPGDYLRWYMLEKPFLLWDWDIRMGAGDVYFHEVRKSPLETNPTLHAIKRLLQALNPVIFALSALGSIVVLAGWPGRARRANPTAVLVAGFCIYATLVHVVFQAEPRYSIPYRPMQLLMLAGILSSLSIHRFRTWRTHDP